MRSSRALLGVLAASAALAWSSGARAALRVSRGSSDLAIPAGQWRVDVEVEPGALTTVLLVGEPDGLSHFAVQDARVFDALEEDGRLPRAASLIVPDGVRTLGLSLEVSSDVRLVVRRASPEPVLPRDVVELVGMPSPLVRDDGYLLERPNRYQFARPDVVAFLREGFRDTRARFRRDPIGVVDITQWDGRRPALDVGNPRHVSHDGGRDVDIAIPSTVEPSLQRDHCEKIVSPDPRRGEGHFTAVCRRGTARAFDATRLAYLVGRLAARRVLDRVFLDEEFLEPLAKAADRLARHHVIPRHAAAQLQPEGGVMMHLPWHTDHVHLRFLGPKGRAPVTALAHDVEDP